MSRFLDFFRRSDSSAVLLQRGALVLLVATFIGLVLFRGGSLWWRYEEIMQGNWQKAEQFAHVLSEHLRQTIATIDATFMHLVAHSAQVGGPDANPEQWNDILEAAFSGLKAIDRVSVVDRSGIVRHSTRPATVRERQTDHPVFQLLAETMDVGLVATATYRDLETGRLLLPFARALTATTNEFDGIVTALFDPQLLREFYRAIHLGDQTIISIISQDGEVLYRQGPADDLSILAQVVREFGTTPSAQAIDATRALDGAVGTGGNNYFTVARKIHRAPIAVAVSLADADTLRSWHDELNLSVIVLGTVALLLAMGGLLLSRVLRARAAADFALKANQARFHEMMYHAPIFVSVKDTEGRIKFINKALEEYFGLSRNVAAGKKLEEVVAHGIGPGALISTLDQEVIKTRAPLQRELAYSTRNGTRSALFVKFPLFDGEGNVDSVASFSMDLTEQRRATAWFRAIVDHAPLLIALKDTEGRFVFVNRGQAAATGIEASEFLGKKTGDLFPPEYAEQHDRFDREVIEARAPLQHEFAAPYKSGTRSLLFVKFPIFDANGKIEFIGSIAADVTAQRQSEAQLVHAQRMEAVGQLTGGIAHDFNNLLTVMIGNSELLTAALANDKKLEPLARMTLEAAERSAALTQRLLAFGRRQMLEPRPTDIGRLVDDIHDFIVRAAGVQAKVDIRSTEEGLWPALVDPAQLETAILNLVVNSRDAMPDGGRIVIEFANVTIDESYLELNPDANAGDYAMVAVSDTGSGMPPEVVARVFEPFFTTKEAGKGTGLGLPTIYGFVKQSGGHVKIYSEVGHGTSVRLYFPRASAPSMVPELPSESTQHLPRGYESILLVEDDRAVRTYVESQLLDLGYRVTTAASGREALQLSRLVGRPDLLVTDVILGGDMNGRQLAERMRERWPDMKVLYISGYADGVLPQFVDGQTDGMHFLAKPFRRRDLALKVREVLECENEQALFTA